MKRCLVALTLVVLFVLPIVASIKTDIIVKTAPNHDVMFSFYDPVQDELINRTKSVSSIDETASTSFENNGGEFDIIIFISKFGEKVLTEKFSGQETGGELVYELYPDNYIPLSEQIPEESEVVIEEQNITEEQNLTEEIIISKENEDTPLTGLSTVEGNKTFIPSVVYYVIGLVFIMGVVIFLVSKMVMRRKNSSEPREIKVTKLSEMNKGPVTLSQEIEEAERKIREAQASINKLKNEEKIKIAEAKMRKDKEELDALKRGDY